MELLALLLDVTLFIVKVMLGLAAITILWQIGVMISDHFTGRTNDLYELIVRVVVGLEFFVRPTPKKVYHGRHHLNNGFISTLVKEMRSEPLSLCYKLER